MKKQQNNKYLKPEWQNINIYKIGLVGAYVFDVTSVHFCILEIFHNFQNFKCGQFRRWVQKVHVTGT